MYQVSACPLTAPRFNVLMSSLSGLTFFVGWWLLVDRNSLYSEDMKGVYNVPIFFGTLAFAVINLVPPGHFGQDNWYAGGSFSGHLAVRLVLFFGFMTAFGALIAASYVLFNDYILDEHSWQNWPGYSVFLENICIFSSSVLMRLRKPKDDYLF